jgi:8-oxo-dGTP diphosphatase
MRSRAHSSAAAPGRPIICSLDAVCLAVEGRDIVVLLQRKGGTWRLPGTPWRGRPSLSDAVASLIRETLGSDATWHEQVGAFAEGPQAGKPGLSVVFAVLSARGAELPVGSEWRDAEHLPGGLAPHQQTLVRAAVGHVRDRMDQVPIAFRLVPPLFTLGELQRVYEVLLGRRLHKASFRRALQAAALVEGTDNMRRDGRGRPAQLFRHVPSRQNGLKRALHFELLGSHTAPGSVTGAARTSPV